MISKGQSRFVDDIRRYPVDEMARRVTGRGARWCTPESDDLPRIKMPEGIKAKSELQILWHRLKPQQKLDLDSLVRSYNMPWGRARAIAKLMLGIELRPKEADRLARYLRQVKA